MEKAKRDFGFVPQFGNFKDMMLDMKQDIDQRKYYELFHYEV